MSLLPSVAIFFVIWWLCLFVVLPFGVKSQHEAGEVTPGTEAGAPHRPHLLRRAAGDDRARGDHLRRRLSLLRRVWKNARRSVAVKVNEDFCRSLKEKEQGRPCSDFRDNLSSFTRWTRCLTKSSQDLDRE